MVWSTAPYNMKTELLATSDKLLRENQLLS